MKTETVESDLAAAPNPSVALFETVPLFAACSLHMGPHKEDQASGLNATAEEVVTKRFHEKMQSASV